jgi:hypothetical protein
VINDFVVSGGMGGKEAVQRLTEINQTVNAIMVIQRTGYWPNSMVENGASP